MLSYLINEIEKSDASGNVEITARSNKDSCSINKFELIKDLFNDQNEFDILLDVKNDLISIAIYQKGAEFEITVELKDANLNLIVSDLIGLDLNKDFKYWITLL